MQFLLLCQIVVFGIHVYVSYLRDNDAPVSDFW